MLFYTLNLYLSFRYSHNSSFKGLKIKQKILFYLLPSSIIMENLSKIMTDKYLCVRLFFTILVNHSLTQRYHIWKPGFKFNLFQYFITTVVRTEKLLWQSIHHAICTWEDFMVVDNGYTSSYFLIYLSIYLSCFLGQHMEVLSLHHSHSNLGSEPCLDLHHSP